MRSDELQCLKAGYIVLVYYIEHELTRYTILNCRKHKMYKQLHLYSYSWRCSWIYVYIHIYYIYTQLHSEPAGENPVRGITCGSAQETHSIDSPLGGGAHSTALQAVNDLLLHTPWSCSSAGHQGSACWNKGTNLCQAAITWPEVLAPVQEKYTG